LETGQGADFQAGGLQLVVNQPDGPLLHRHQLADDTRDIDRRPAAAGRAGGAG